MSKNALFLKNRRVTAKLSAVLTKTRQILIMLVFLSSVIGQPTSVAKADTPVGKYDWQSITVEADNYFDDRFLPVNTIDADSDNIWLNHIDDTLPTSIWYEFPAEETISKIGLWQADYTAGWSYRIKTYEVFVSTDEVNWTSVATNTGTDVPHAYQETSFTPVAAKFVKITAAYPSWETGTYQTYDTKNWIGLDGFQAYDQNGNPLINSAPLLLPRYTLTVTTNGSGSVTLDPPGGTYNQGTLVQLNAEPAAGWAFSGWSGALNSNTSPESITISADTTVTATFMEVTVDCYPLNISHTGEGSNPVADPLKSAECPTNGQYVANASIALNNAAPEIGWQIDGWTGTLNNDSTAGNNTVTMPASAHTVSVIYGSTTSAVPTPAVAIHVSETTNACWSSLSGPHDDWKYWHIYGFLMEALTSDGTPYVVVSDSDITEGALLNGAEPKYPILISLAATCISDATANEIKQFVEAGGHVYVGSTSWTRDQNGNLRGSTGAPGKYDPSAITVEADNYFNASFLPANTIDADPDNLWLNEITDELPTSIWYEFPAEETISKIGLWQASYEAGGGVWSYRLRDYEVFVSTNGVDWTSVATNTGTDVPHAYQETSFTPVAAKFVKITAKYPSWEDLPFETYNTANWIGLDGFQAYDGSGNPLIDSAPLLSTASAFALSAEMGLTPEGTGLIGTIQKVANHPIVSHLTETDVRNWLLPKAYTATGYTHPTHWAQFVTATDATVLLTSDDHPTLAVKDYGSGRFIYHSEFSPLAGYSGYVVDNFEYGFFRKAIEEAFKANEVPLVRLSGWPYPYNAAFKTRHDHFLRKAASDVEAAYDVRGEWLLRTSSAIGGPDWGYLSQIRANGALIGSHTLNEYTLDSGGYSAAYSNINQSLNDLATALGARPEIFVAPGMMAFRDTSLDAIVDNNIKTTGDMSHGPYPNFALKIDTATDYGPNAHWPVLEIPVSRYYAKPGETWGDLIYSHIGSMNLTDELAYIEKTVDLTYDLGGVINLYDHVGDIGSLWIHPDVAPFEHYISYSLGKPYVWNTDPLEIYDWWIKRDAVSIVPSVLYTESDQIQVDVNVSGPNDQGPYALDIAIPAGHGVHQIQVNGNTVTAYRVEGQKLKVSIPVPAQVEVLFGAPAAVECYALTVGHTGQGSDPEASPENSTGCASGHYVAGENVTLSDATPAAGWKIQSWTGTNDDTSASSINTAVMPAGAHTVGVVYAEDNPLVGYWNFDDGTGNTASDSSVYGNDGLVSGAIWTAGPFDGALNFDGTNDYVQIPASPSLSLATNQVTFATWLRADTFNASWSTLMQRSNADLSWFDWQLYARDGWRSNRPSCRIDWDTDKQRDSNEEVEGTFVLQPGVWYHMACTYDGTSMKLYINGTLQDTALKSGGAIPNSGRGIRLGGNETWGSYFDGILDETYIYNRALNAADIQALMTATPPACHALTLGHTGEGTDPVASPTSSAGCTAGNYLAGELITLTASPASGWYVHDWDGTTNDISASTTNTVTMPAAAHLAAVNYRMPPDTTITSNPDSPTQSTTASFSFTSDDPTPTFECQLDGGGFSACTSPKIYSGLADGSHTFEVRAKDPAGNVDSTPASYTWTINTSTSYGAGTYDDVHAAWTYSGTWDTYNGAGPYSSTLHQSNTAGSYAQVVVNGAKIKLTYLKAPGRGSIDVYIDGTKVDTVDANSTGVTWQASWTSQLLTAGMHIVRFVNTTGGWIDLDAIQVQAPVMAGIYDDADAAWVYSGIWDTYSGADPYSNTMHQSNVKDSSAEVIFNGAQIKLSYLKAPGRGFIDVYIDGTKVTTLHAESGDITWQSSWTSHGLPAGVHTVRFVHAGGGWIDLDAIQVFASATPPTPPGAGTYDDFDEIWTYSGTWETYSGAGPYSNTLHQNNTMGDYAEVTFSGVKVTLSYLKAPGRGLIDVYIDGTKVDTLDANSMGVAWQSSWTSRGLPAGVHTVRFVHAGGGWIDLDAVQVQVPVTSGTYDDAHVAWTYSGTWETYSGAGPYSNTLHQNNTMGDYAEVTFSGVKVTLSYLKAPGRGLIDVYIDGTKVDTLDTNSMSVAWQAGWTSQLLTTGVHTVRFVHAGGGWIDLDAVQVQVPVTSGTYDDSTTAWAYAGAWTTYSGAGPYSNTLHHNNTMGNYAEVVFNGAQIKLSYLRAPGRGSIDVYIDGTKVITLSANSTGITWQPTWTSQLLTAGIHTVRFENASGGWIDLDAIQILP